MTTINKPTATGSQLYWVAENVISPEFPDVATALRDPDGLLAIGGDLSPERVLDAYRQGIFPWYSDGQPILWWSPNPRCVLHPDDLRISRSLRRTLRSGKFNVTFNRAFAAVIGICAEPRRESDETWITEAMLTAYSQLHESGHAISVETWLQGTLVGGLYGVVLDRIFFGESMFSNAADASKVALVHLVSALKRRNFRLIDCQIHSRHLQSLGAKPMPRRLFVNILAEYGRGDKRHIWPDLSTLS